MDSYASEGYRFLQRVIRHFCSVVKSCLRFPAVLINREENFNALSNVRRNAWIQALKRGPLSESHLRNGRICSRHFITGKPAALDDKSNPDWIPNQNLGYVSQVLPEQCASSRFERPQKNARIQEEVQTKAVEKSAEHLDDTIPSIHENCVNESVQTDLTDEYLSHVFTELNFCNSKIYSLQMKQNTMDLNEDSFKEKRLKNKLFYWSS